LCSGDDPHDLSGDSAASRERIEPFAAPVETVRPFEAHVDGKITRRERNPHGTVIFFTGIPGVLFVADQELSRRRLLIGASAVSIVSLAGCLGNDDDEPENEEDTNGEENGDDEEQELEEEDGQTLHVMVEDQDGNPVSDDIEITIDADEQLRTYTYSEEIEDGQIVDGGAEGVDVEPDNYTVTVESLENEFEPVEEDVTVEDGEDEGVTLTVDMDSEPAEDEADDEDGDDIGENDE
jgi:hypothetical protein